MTRVISVFVIVTALAVSLSAQQPPAVKPIPAPEDVAKPPADAATTTSGLASKVLQPGKGTAKPAATDLVTVHYTGWTTDGKMFDSSHARNAPSTFPLDRVIKGWGEGVQLMTVGESDLAHAHEGRAVARGKAEYGDFIACFQRIPAPAAAAQNVR